MIYFSSKLCFLGENYIVCVCVNKIPDYRLMYLHGMYSYAIIELYLYLHVYLTK